MENLSKIGFGTIGISGSWSKVSEKTSINTIISAIETGINWIDTSPMYGLGQAETFIRKAIINRRDKVFIATKCGLALDHKGKIVKNLSKNSILKEIDESLTRLNLTEIDLYQCHWPDISTTLEETMETMIRLIEVGKVKKIGLCNYGVVDLKVAHSICPVFSVQGAFNLLNNASSIEVINFCVANDIKYIGYSPLQCGILSDNFKLENLEEYDFRLTKKDWFTSNKIAEISNILLKLKEIAKEKNCTTSQIAIAWALSNPSISSVIVGASNSEQIKENIKSVNLKFSIFEMKNLNSLFNFLA